MTLKFLFERIMWLSLVIAVGAYLWSAIISNDSADALRAIHIGIVSGIVSLIACAVSCGRSNPTEGE